MSGGITPRDIVGALASVAVAIAAGALLASAPGNELRERVLAWVSSPPAPAYQSSMAATCDRGWGDQRDNRDQIHCYMANNLVRLCDPRERRALVDRLYAYQAALKRAEDNLARAAQTQAHMPGAFAYGAEDRSAAATRFGDALRRERLGEAPERSHESLTEKAMAAFAGNDATTGDLAQDVTTLAEAGYIDASDFRAAYPPEAVEIGLASVRQVRKICR